MLDVEETPLNLFQSHGSSGSYNEFDIYASASLAKKRQRTYSRWSPIEEGVTLVWENLSVYSSTTKNGQMQHKQIINGVTGAVKAGSLVAIMGSSGAGKSTLMTALGYRTEGSILTEGNILINGRQIGDYMKYLSGFMHQEDMLLSYLTVREHMNIMANLKLDRRLSGNDKKQLIYDILRQLGLMKCIDLKIGGIDQAKSLSGGEKKRLAFATELLTDPPLLFCDEPTTGLDSYSAQKLVVIMNQMAITGKTILCTIHQPSSDIFAMFSQLILVADGRIAYMGSTNNALDFFERMGYVCPTSYNPADFYIKTLSTTPGYEDNCRQTVKRICDQFAVSDEAKEVEIVVQYELHMGRVATQRKFELRQNFKEIRWLSKLFWLTYRWILEIYRNPSLEAMKIAQRMLIGFIVGFCYLGTDALTQNGVQSVTGIIFMFVSENTFNPMYSVLHQFPSYLPLFLREYKSGLYHPATYYLSRILSLLPGFILEPLIFVITAYWLAGLRTSGYAFLMTLSVIVLTMNVSSACGVMFSNAFDSVPTALAYLVPFDYAHMITSGVFVKLSTLPLVFSWIKYLSWLMYSTEALYILQWKDVTNITCVNPPEGFSCMNNGQDVLARYDFKETDFQFDIFGMLVLLLCFYILGYFFLWRRVRYH
ncbi:protein scarlet isoform X1 [Diabrotica virgifera virgifera]|uniref:ABC transporter domain-containing protein n=1 Tax=Diabrotica virgifera virgifera TaxID=50390 RepID=A0ABM5IFF0_DIAVI|nr:protein scarlet isoform X1 [Diabrotica virgifera virgifera]